MTIPMIYDLPLWGKLALALVPFLAIVTGGWILGAIPENSVTGWLFQVIAEKDLGKLMRYNGFSRMSIRTFQIGRIAVALFGSIVLTGAMGFDNLKNWVLGALILAGLYKLFYIYLFFADNARIKRLNSVLPYTIKSIAYLANVYPVNNALIKSIEIVPKEFKEDIKTLCEEIDEDPTGFAPYQAFIDRYDGRLNRLDYYLKTLYRMSMSASEEETRLLTNLNDTISDEMSLVRQTKNNAVNNTVSYLGLIPVALLTIMLLFLMVTVSLSII